LGAIPSNFFDCSLDYLIKDDISEMNSDSSISEKDISIKKRKFKLTKSWIIKIVATLPAFLLLALWAISKIVEFPITHQDSGSSNFYTGFSGFVNYFRLTGVIYVCIIIWLISTVVDLVWRLYTFPDKIGKKFLFCYLIRFALIIVSTFLFIYGLLNPWKFNWTI